ncbi:aromatic ring-hydroxylating oxygenase subunit alpha [Marinobacterium jannaschii]|uniref:aromatic ring-hydroxylating oxygenase subunit alpha n=1 Tax=Marinobacterium jannaschii TaxID=64970 RepID=UPI000683D7CE|nr:aromatic ring-hydroxylating dioxygenase subunit alpha [Marinobacterium jannaschii]
MQKSLPEIYQQSASAGADQAHCLPFAVYHDAEIFALEVAQLFHNDWVFACAEAKLSEPGDYFALDIAGEPVALLRGRDGELRGLSNICRHRGTSLLDDGFGRIEKNIVCPYHAWTYGDNGDLKGVPFDSDNQVDKDRHCLPHFAVACWQGLVFINLAEKPRPFSERVKGLDDYLALFDLSRYRHGYHAEAEHWNANWKLALENGMESYHLFKVHKETLEPMTPSKQAYYVAGSSEWTLTGGAMKDNRSKVVKWLSGSYPEAYNHYLLLSLPPSLVMVITYEGVDWIQVLPDGPEQCRVIPGGLTEKPVASFDSPEFQFTASFLAEDQAICERVQRGMHATKGQGGKLVEMEQILVDFRHYLANRLFASPPAPFSQTEAAQLFLK